MALSFNRYVNITSGVGAGATVNQRELIGRLFTTNPLLPTESFIEFTSAAQVSAYFGSTSVEYARALFYFSWISKNITAPGKISFARWTNANEAPMIFGAKLTETLSGFNLITNGSFSLTLGTTTNIISGLNLSSAGSLAAIATIIQTAIQAETGSGLQWTSATVTYNATPGQFNFVGGDPSTPAVISVGPAGTGTDISGIMGWLQTGGAIWSNGVLTETLTDTLNQSIQNSTNFGSFLFIPTLNTAQITEVATWTDGQNVLYQYMVPVTLLNYSAISTAISGYGGCGMTLAPSTSPAQFPEQCPMMILAATNYNAANSVQNYMFQQFNLTPSVIDDATANTLIAANVNFYGVTQTAGQFLAFYQTGILTGGPTDPLDMNTFANEQWLKDAIGAAIMQIFLSLAKVSANAQGRALLLVVIQNIVLQALLNGTISVDKTLTQTQQLYITEITNDPNAWQQVQSSGYWLDAEIAASGSPPVFNLQYTLVYSKDDVIRLVDGTHVLI